MQMQTKNGNVTESHDKHETQIERQMQGKTKMQTQMKMLMKTEWKIKMQMKIKIKTKNAKENVSDDRKKQMQIKTKVAEPPRIPYAHTLILVPFLPGPSRRLAPVLKCKRSVFSTLHC